MSWRRNQRIKMVDVDTARRKLLEALGEYAEKYWSNMKLWYKQKISKDDFDSQAFELLGPGKINYHNEFIISIIAKCQIIANSTPSSTTQAKTTTKSNNKPVHLRKARVKRSSDSPVPPLQPFEVQNSVEVPPSFITKGEDQDVTSCSQDLVLPDLSTLHGRLFLGAWDGGLDSIADETAPLLVAAVETHLKNILSACVSRRKSFNIRLGSHFKYRYGCSNGRNDIRNERICDESTRNHQRTYDQAEAFAYTRLASSEVTPAVRSPITLFTLRDTLMESSQIIPSHTVRGGSMERILNALWHPGHEEIQQNKLYMLDTRKVHEKVKQQRGLRAEFPRT